MSQLPSDTNGVQELERLETEINTEAFEAFYHIGQKLLKIKRDRLYENAGFKTWGAYCASGRIDYKKSRADDAIRCSELRKKLPGIPGSDWSVDQVLALCKCETDNDAKRVAKKAISLAKKSGQRVTAKLIAKLRDGDDETGAAKVKRERELQSASLENHLTKLADTLTDWRKSLEQIDLEQWDSVPSRVLTRVKNEADALSLFLKD